MPTVGDWLYQVSIITCLPYVGCSLAVRGCYKTKSLANTAVAVEHQSRIARYHKAGLNGRGVAFNHTTPQRFAKIKTTLRLSKRKFGMLLLTQVFFHELRADPLLQYVHDRNWQAGQYHLTIQDCEGPWEPCVGPGFQQRLGNLTQGATD